VVFPTRYQQLTDVHKKHGSQADKVALFLNRGDPAADALVAFLNSRSSGTQAKKMFTQALQGGAAAVSGAPQELRTFFAHVEQVPSWVDWDKVALGGRTQLRCGILCGMVLGCCGLPMAYRSGAANKPLVFTKKLLEKAPGRLRSTNRFFVETCTPGGLRPGQVGWAMTVRIRVMHAEMRRVLLQTKARPWKHADWGSPLNQLDMAATQTLFSVSLLHNLRRLGFWFSRRESDAVVHLWRYVGYLLGLEMDLMPTTESAGRQLQELLLDVAGGPDEDSIRLTAALMEVAVPGLLGEFLPLPGVPDQGPPRSWLARTGRGMVRWLLGRLTGDCPHHLGRICYGLSYDILGSQVAAELRYPPTWWRYSVQVLHSLLQPLEVGRLVIPWGSELALAVGHRQLRRLTG
jgi:hypothetical protein